MGKYSEYRAEGYRAYKSFLGETLLEVVDEIEQKQGKLYSDKGMFDEVRENIRSSMHNGEKEALHAELKMYNKNPVLAFAFGVLGEHVLAHQNEINEFMKNAKQYVGVDLYELGYDDGFILRVLSQAKNKGVFGEGSGMDTLVSKIIADLPQLVQGVGSKHSKVFIAKMVLASSGITPESIQQAYASGGLFKENGVLYHLIKQLRETPQGRELSKYLAGRLQETLKKKDVDICLTEIDLDRIVNAAVLYATDGENGAVNIGAKEILPRINGYGSWIFAAYAQRFAEQDYDIVERIFKKEGVDAENILEGLAFTLFKSIARTAEEKGDVPFARTLREALSELEKKERKQKIKKLAKQNTPEPLEDKVLQPQIQQHGLMGERGYFAYMARNMPVIMSPFEAAWLITKEEIADISARYKEISEITEFKELVAAHRHLIDPIFKPKGKQSGDWLVELAMEAERKDVTASDLLANSDEYKGMVFQTALHAREKQKLIRNIYRIKETAHEFANSIDLLDKIQQLKSKAPEKTGQVLSSVISYINFESARNPAFVDKLRDYARFVGDFSSALVQKV